MTKLLFALSAFFPILIAALGVPLARGQVTPNGIYGFRTARSLSSPELWYEFNRLAGLSMVGAGLVALVATGLIWLLLNLSPAEKTGLSAAALAVSTVSVVAIPLVWGPRN